MLHTMNALTNLGIISTELSQIEARLADSEEYLGNKYDPSYTC